MNDPSPQHIDHADDIIAEAFTATLTAAADKIEELTTTIDAIRARLDKYTDMYSGGSIVPGGVISDLYAILDTAKEPK